MKNLRAYGRALAAIVAVLVAVVGITYAVLNTQASLLASSLSTTSADLLIWDGDSFKGSAPGFTVTDLVPGIGSQEYLVSFKNTGGMPLAITTHVPTSLKFSGFNSTAASTAMKAVKVTLKNLNTGDKTDTSLYNLTLSTEVALPGAALRSGIAGNPASLATEGNYSIKFDVDPTAIGTAKASVEPFDLTFTGKQVATTTVAQ